MPHVRAGCVYIAAMKPSVYIETSVVSYYTARLSRDLVVAGHQAITRHWWEQRLVHFRPFISTFVLDEAAAGDHVVSQVRVAALRGIPLLDITQEVETLAQRFVRAGVVPRSKVLDAYHVCVAAVHGVDYLVTWNCAHIANAEMREAIEALCAAHEYPTPVICTPEELMGVQT